MLDIKKRKILIILSVLVVITLIVAFFVFNDHEEDLNNENNNTEVMIMNQRNSNSLEDLVDGSGNIEVNIVNRQGNPQDIVIKVDKDKCAEERVDAGFTRLSILQDIPDNIKTISRHGNGNVEQEFIYGCRSLTRDSFEMVRVAENYYGENGEKIKEIGYHFPQQLLDKSPYEGDIRIASLPNIVVWDIEDYKKSSYYLSGRLSYLYIPDKAPYLSLSSDFNDGEDLIKKYEVLHNNQGEIDKITIYYQNGAKYLEHIYRGGVVYETHIYSPDGKKVNAGVQTLNTQDDYREIEWFNPDNEKKEISAFFDPGGSQRKISTEKFYGVDGKTQTRQIQKYAILNQESGIYTSIIEEAIYYEEFIFRIDGSLEQIIEKSFVYGDYSRDLDAPEGYIKTTITYYDENSVFIKKEIYKKDTLEEVINYEDMYSKIEKEFSKKILNVPNITQKQKNNAVQNAKTFISFCDRQNLGGFGITKDVSFGAIKEGGYAIICSAGPYNAYATINDKPIIRSTIYDGWLNQIKLLDYELQETEAYPRLTGRLSDYIGDASH